MRENAIILFTRLPIPGQTKTRLMPHLTGEQCAQLHKAMLLDIMAVLRQLQKDIFVFHTPTDDPMHIRSLESMLGPAQYYAQQGQDFGCRMNHALSSVLERGYKNCLLMGADIPFVSPQDFIEIDAALGENDVVLCPSDDGGYWLVGLKKTFAPLFSQKQYGGNSVIEEAVSVCQQHGYSIGIGKTKRDIDTYEDLKYYASKIMETYRRPRPAPKHTTKILQLVPSTL